MGSWLVVVVGDGQLNPPMEWQRTIGLWVVMAGTPVCVIPTSDNKNGELLQGEA